MSELPLFSPPGTSVIYLSKEIFQTFFLLSIWVVKYNMNHALNNEDFNRRPKTISAGQWLPAGLDTGCDNRDII